MKPHSITVRLGPDLKQRLHQSARKLDLSENNIAKQAVRAAVDFIEANNYRIELPLQMAAANGPIKSRVRRPKKVTGLDETERRYPKRKRIPLLS
jgi:predicted transcriptional regulator